MEYLQGASIARFYGFFEGEIDSNSEVLDWAESDEMYNEEMKQELEYEESGSKNEDENKNENEGDDGSSILAPIAKTQVYGASTIDLSYA